MAATSREQPSLRNLCLGIDGGGSHTAACLLDPHTGRILGIGEAGPSNPHAVGDEEAARAIAEAARLAIAHSPAGALRPRSLYAAVSGAGRPAERQALQNRLAEADLAECVHVGHDATALLGAARILKGPCLTGVAGTGSIVWGLDANGREMRADGWGPLLGDLGGAVRLGQEGLRAACRAHDGTGPETILLERALGFWEIRDLTGLIHSFGGDDAPRHALAAFAPEVLGAAHDMDAVAVGILERAAGDFAECLLGVRARLGAPEEPVPVVLGGRLLRDLGLFCERLVANYHISSPRDLVLIPAARPEVGAAMQAAAAIGFAPPLPSAGLRTIHADTPVLPAVTASGPAEGASLRAAAGRDDAQRVFDECSRLPTEQLHPRAGEIGQMGTLEIVRLMNREDSAVAPAVEAVLPEVAATADEIVQVFRGGGRLFYVGAGTSGRLGSLDAAECPPTFGTPPRLVQSLIAGGYATLLRSREGAEDQADQAARDLARRGFCERDFLVGIAASRRTPYVLAALEYACSIGAATALVTCSPPDKPLPTVRHLIAPRVGPEIVMGSTRLKSGTAQKMVLNMLTTAAMIRQGKVYRGMMVDLQMSCGKLAERAKRTVMMLTGLDYDGAVEILRRSEGSVKTAIVMHAVQCDAEEARRRLEKAQGFVAAAIGQASPADS